MKMPIPMKNLRVKRAAAVTGVLLAPILVTACHSARTAPATPQFPGVKLVSEGVSTTPMPATPAGPASKLVPAADLAANGQAEFDFGTISQARTEPLVHDFTLKNTGDTAITIDRVQPQCGCTTAVVQQEGAGGGNTVQPGATVKIHVSIDPGHLIPGPAVKNTIIFVQGQSQPAATLVMKGKMLSLATFQPTSINFGDIPAGSKRAQIITVIYDKSLTTGGALPSPKLGNDVPGLRLVPAKGPDDLAGMPSTTQAFPSGPVDPVPMAQDTVKKYYRLELTPEARIGNTFASVNLDGSARKLTLNAFTSVMWNVIGDIQAAPNSVAFGTVVQGTAQTLKFLITGKKNANTKSLKVVCDNDYLTAKYTPSPASTLTIAAVPGATGQVLELGSVDVTLKANAPAGSLQSKITVSTADGQMLDVPVWAYIPAITK